VRIRARFAKPGGLGSCGSMGILVPMPIRRASRFFQQDVWAVDLEAMRGIKVFLYRIARVFYLAFRGFLRDHGMHRASALAFDTVLGLVPLLAFVVAAVKGFGAYDTVMEGTVRPWIDETFHGMGEATAGEGVITLKRAFLQVLTFVDRADFAGLGAFGLIVLLYIVVLLLMSVEDSLNHIFGVERSRTLTRKIADYSAILFIAPICFTVAATISAQAKVVEWHGAGFILQLLAILAMSFGLAMLYIVIPYTKVRVTSALFGGFIAGVLWYVTLVLHVVFQLGVARYNAIYSTFAVIPLFLIWVFVSWLVVIFGAELTAAHMNMGAFRWRVRGKDADFAAKEYVALRALVAIADAFLRGDKPRNLRDLAVATRVPDQLVEQVLESFTKRGVLAKTSRGGLPAWVLARDLDGITVAAVLDLVKHDSAFSIPPPTTAADVGVRKLIEGLDHALEKSPQNLNLRDLVAQAHYRASGNA
jgi:membrane protein